MNQEDPKQADGFRWFLGLVFLLVATMASGLLLMKEMGVIGVTLPGCGEQSACGDLSRGFFGSVPGIGWPTSYLGFTFFIAMMVAWPTCWPKVSRGLVLITRLGVIMSVVFLIVILIEWKLCPYCIVAHVANIAFWITVEYSKHSSKKQAVEGSSMPALTTFAISWIIGTGGLALGQSQVDHIDDMQRAVSEQANMDEIVKATLSGGVDPIKKIDEADNDGVFEAPDTAIKDPGEFGGRYVLGPDNATVQIVMVGDYQCPDCNRYEKIVAGILEDRDDVSLSIRHFPFNSDCNPYVSKTLHGNACWASKFAETAGILGGEESFWDAHRLLFEVKGKFTRDEFPALVQQLGFDPQTFQQVMVGPVVDAIIQEDIEIGGKLGVYFTPMIFVNGVQLKWWQTRMDLPTTVDQLATAIADGRNDGSLKAPLNTEQKYIDDWRTGLARKTPEAPGRAMGMASAPHSILVFSDYTDPDLKGVNDRIVKLMKKYPGQLKYDILASPKNPDCNPRIMEGYRDLFPSGCIAAKAVKASAKLGGKEAYWAMIDYLMIAGQQVTLPEIVSTATEIGLDRNAFIEAVSSNEIEAQMATDVLRTKGWGMRSFPAIVVDGKLIPRWRLGDKKIVEQVVEIAVTEE